MSRVTGSAKPPGGRQQHRFSECLPRVFLGWRLDSNPGCGDSHAVNFLLSQCNRDPKSVENKSETVQCAGQNWKKDLIKT